VDVSGVDFAQFDGLYAFLDDAVDAVHFLWPVEIPVRLEVVGEYLNALLCKILYSFDKVPDIFVEVLISSTAVIPPKVLEPVIDSIMRPEVDQHDSVRLVLLDPIVQEVVVIFINSKLAALGKHRNKSGQLVSPIFILCIFIELSKPECRIVSVGVAI
jgi:hypothetical protein